MTAGAPRPTSLGEWVCLGALYDGTSHGWAIARRLRADGDLGRVWQLSRPLTYRALEHLAERGWVNAVGEEESSGGPTRTLLAATRTGREHLRAWVRTPVEQIRDMRSELLLKLLFATELDIDLGTMLDEQRAIVGHREVELRAELEDAPEDLVLRWRVEMAGAATRFVDSLG